MFLFRKDFFFIPNEFILPKPKENHDTGLTFRGFIFRLKQLGRLAQANDIQIFVRRIAVRAV